MLSQHHCIRNERPCDYQMELKQNAYKRCMRLQWLDHMKTNHFKMLLNVFSTTFTYSNCIVY